MSVLGIDYGRKKMGLALAESKLAEPYKVIRIKSIDQIIKEIVKIVEVERVEKVIVGVSEGKMGEEAKKFASALSFKLSAKVETFDETLTTHEAQELSQEAGIRRSKRKNLEDAYAATVILQGYLDSR